MAEVREPFVLVPVPEELVADVHAFVVRRSVADAYRSRGGGGDQVDATDES